MITSAACFAKTERASDPAIIRLTIRLVSGLSRHAPYRARIGGRAARQLVLVWPDSEASGGIGDALWMGGLALLAVEKGWTGVAAGAKRWRRPATLPTLVHSVIGPRSTPRSALVPMRTPRPDGAACVAAAVAQDMV